MVSVPFLSALIRLRIMPMTIACLSMMFCIKVYDLVEGTNQLSRTLLASDAVAVTPDATEAATPEPAPAKEDTLAAAGAEKEKDAKQPEKEAAAAPAGEENQKLDKEYLESPEAKQRFSQVELDILQSLAARREKIEKWEEDVHMKENLLAATELRINKRIDEIKTLEQNVRGLLAQYEKQEDANIRSLVKIYENMKAKDAARIFDELEMPVLMMVADRMAERKAAPILAKMNPKKAKELTVELAEQRKMLNDTKQALDASAMQ